MAGGERDKQGLATERQLPFSRILITGADGFVGRNLVPALFANLRQGGTIFLASRTSAGSTNGLQHVAFDLEDAEAVERAIESVQPDLIIHLAAQASVGQGLASSAATWSVNLCGSLNLARAVARIVPGCTVLYASSAEVYGLTFNHETVTEDSALRPQSAYSSSKAAAEAMFRDVLPSGSQLIIVRPSNHSGPGQDERFVIPAFAAQIARIEQGAPAVISTGNLDAERDFLDVRDVVAAYVSLLSAAKSLPSRSCFNIASGCPISIGSILQRLREMSWTKTDVVRDPERIRPSEVPKVSIDSTAISDAVGWIPAFTLQSTLESVLNSQRERLRDMAG